MKNNIVKITANAKWSRCLNLMSYNTEAFSRNIGLLTLAEQEKLASIKVAIAGMGGVGGVHLITLLRTGFAHFNISDMDEFELANMNRQYGAKVSNLDQPKVEVMAKEAQEINPYAKIKTFPKGIDEENIDEFLKNIDIVVDGMDAFNIKIRRLIFNKALAKGIPVVCAGPIGFSSAVITFMPNKMSFDKYFDIHDGMNEDEQLLRFFIGIAPKSTQLKYSEMNPNVINTKSGPSLSLACQMCSATATTEVLRIVLEKKGIKAAPHYFQYDLLTRKFINNFMPMGNRNPLQKLKLSIARKRLKNTHILGPDKIVPPEHRQILKGDTPNSIMKYLLRAGQQAPSGENVQPWLLSSHNNNIKVQLDPNADKSLFNVNQIASGLACGAVVENIKLAASRYGLLSEIALQDPTHDNELSINIKLIPGFITEDPKAKFIWERQTNRTKYNKKPIPEKDLEALRVICSDSNNDVKLDLFTKKNDIKVISKMVFKADQLRMETQSIHNIFMSHLHFTDEEAYKKRNGFPLKNLEAGLDGELFLRLIKPWKVANRMNKFGMSKVAANIASKGIKEASAMGMIRIKGRDMQSFFEGGRAMQRVWLEATRLGISFQPMTVVSFLWMNWQFGNNDVFSDKHKALLESIWPDYEKLFTCNNEESHIMLFRLGYGSKMKVGTLRKKQ